MLCDENETAIQVSEEMHRMSSDSRKELQLPDDTLNVLRCYGICPEWFATKVCTQFFRDMMADEANFIGIMQQWAQYKGLNLDDVTAKAQQAAAA